MLLGSVVWIVSLIEFVFMLFDYVFLWCDMILLLGGLFFVWKVIMEIYYYVLYDGDVVGGVVGVVGLMVWVVIG